MRIRLPTAAPFDWPRARTVHAAGDRDVDGRGAGTREIGVYEYGDPLGSPVFALHGTPSCGAGFAWTDMPARAHGLRIIAPDRPGIGRSARVPMPTVADYGADLGMLADALDIERFTVLGYSGGGPYALAAAAGLGPRVQSAAIVAGAGELGAWATFSDLERSDRQMTWLSLHAPVVARFCDLLISARGWRPGSRCGRRRPSCPRTIARCCATSAQPARRSPSSRKRSPTARPAWSTTTRASRDRGTWRSARSPFPCTAGTERPTRSFRSPIPKRSWNVSRTRASRRGRAKATSR